MSDWTRPTELPDLRGVGIVAIDTETDDRWLREDRGSGWPVRAGHIVGVSVAWRAEGALQSSYFPIRYPDSNNFDPTQVFAWLKGMVASDLRFITQNGLYDWGWIRADADILMPPAERLEEIGALATMVDENRFSYGLNSLCEWRGLPGKDTALLKQACKTAGYKINEKNPLQSHIWRLPAHLVGPYAEADPVNTLLLYEDLNPTLEREGTRDAYRLECEMLPIAHAMRRRGIRIDQSAAEQARDYCLAKRDAALAELSRLLGSQVSMGEIASPKWKARTFDTHGVGYPRTPKGNPSFKAGKTGWMAVHPHWLPRGIAQANKYDAAGSKFLEGHILAHIAGGRIHAEINPHRSESGGTKSSRFSYAKPPLQQMPARDQELGPLIRRVFLPDVNEVWAKPDISQQEFRWLVHHAVLRDLPGAKEAAELYRSDPNADFHAIVAEMTGLDRDLAKAVNFAKIYGAGEKMFAVMIGKPLSEARAIIARYDSRLPFVYLLSRQIQNEAVKHGYTVLHDGTRRHWDRYEAAYVFAEGAGPCAYDEAVKRQRDPEHPWFFQEIRRHGTYTALNALIQGDSARQTKMWLRACAREGVIPLLQMHDALESSVTASDQGELIARLGCEVVRLEVPMKVDVKYGRSWGDAKHTWDEIDASAREAPKMTAAETLARHLGAQRTGDGWIACCPLHDDQKPSLSIGAGPGGKVLVHCHAGCDQREVFKALLRGRGVLGKRAVTPTDAAPINRPPSLKRSSSDARQEMDDDERSELAVAIWRKCPPAAGTLAETYLAARGITLPVPESLHFHPHMKHRLSGKWWPAMVALVTNGVDGTPQAIHRTFLAHDGRRKGPVDSPKMMLGPCRGGVVRLAAIDLSRPLMIGEGIETCLSAMQATGHPAWAALSTSGLRALVLPDIVEDVIVLADADVKGEAAARDAAWRWKRKGRRVRIARPPQGSDFNDMLTRRTGT